MAKKKSTTSTTSTKRAAIYVRVSSEKQAEEVSPKTQEADCKAYCDGKGYSVIDVYRDIERYRVGKRLVEPSGTRHDRPQFKRMIADAYAGKFEVIIAWREDRLYREAHPMLDVLDCLEKAKITLELVKETFDPKFAPVKAWAAKMELDAKHDRFMMGVAGRLGKNKVWNNQPPFGYKRVDGKLELDESEAEIVRFIWTSFADGIGAREIRRRLISRGARERHEGNKTPWSTTMIYNVVHNNIYHTGKYSMNWEDEVYTFDAPRIIDGRLHERVQERRRKAKAYPAGGLKYNYLVAGLVYCKACNVRLTAQTVNRPEYKNGIRSEYYCGRNSIGVKQEGCAKTNAARKIDDQVWAKLFDWLKDKERFTGLLHDRIEALRAEEADAEGACNSLEVKLDDILLRRQKDIVLHEEGIITKTDLQLRLGGLTFEQNAIERELKQKQLLTGNKADELMEFAERYQEIATAGFEALINAPYDEEDTQRQFERKREFVERFVTRVDVLPDKSVALHVVFSPAKLALVEAESVESGSTSTRCA